jgi:hypothetical protein
MILAPATSAPLEAVDPLTALRLHARDIRRALLAVRDGAEVVALTHALDPGSLAALLRPADDFAAAGLPGHHAEWAARALVHYILGTVMQEQTRGSLARAGILADAPNPSDEEAAFNFGLALLLDGTAAGKM